MAVAPIQPMSISAQSNLRGMRDEVLSWNPEVPPWMVDQFLNNALRKIIDRRIWSGLLVKDQLVIPDQYTTGTISLTRGSAIGTGTATAWPTNDKVNTTLVSPVSVSDAGILIDVTPASMAGIGIGDWITLDGGTASEEQVLVYGLTATSFKTKVALAHLVGGTVWKSSLVRQQLRINDTSPWYSVKGVSSATRLVLDDLWGGVDQTSTGYSIFLAYVNFGNDCKFVSAMANLNRRYQVTLHFPQEAVNAYDSTRSATESTYLLLDLSPDEIGRARYELYPRPTSAQVFALMYYRMVSPMGDDDDTPPPFIQSDVLVMSGVANALRFRPKDNRFYDAGTALQIARDKDMEFERRVAEMVNADDAIYMQSLRWDFGRWPSFGQGSNWNQSHDAGIAFGEA